VSISAITPVSGVASASSSSLNSSVTALQQTAFNNVFSRLQQSVSQGDLITSQTLLNAVNAISPTKASGTDAIGKFLTSLTTALSDKSVTKAQSALATYQSSTASTSTTPTTPSAPDAHSTAASVASQLIKSQNQYLLATALASLSSSAQNNASFSKNSSNSVSSFYGLLATALGAYSSSSSAPTKASTSPYDTLVNAIQASLAAGHGTLTPALAYLQATGNFVNTSA
jgi:hypothetical protein